MTKIYSKILLSGLCVSALLLVGCDNKKSEDSNAQEPTQNTQPNTKAEQETTQTTPTQTGLTIGINNSTLFHLEPELLSSSKVIKQQIITGENTSKTINYNDQGYILNYDLDGLYADVNYDTAKYLFSMSDKKVSYDITFDNIKNIISMKNSAGDDVANATFDDKGRLIMTKLSHFADNNIIFSSQVMYKGDNVEKMIATVYSPAEMKEQNMVSYKEKEVIYNDKNQLEKTIATTFKLSSDGKVVVDAQNQREIESTEECNYSIYNANNDWTKAKCNTTGSESASVDLTRTIVYK